MRKDGAGKTSSGAMSPISRSARRLCLRLCQPRRAAKTLLRRRRSHPSRQGPITYQRRIHKQLPPRTMV